MVLSILDELLVVNDEFHNVFEKYTRYVNNRASKGESSGSSVAAAAASSTSATGGDDLIDFDEHSASVADQLKNMSKSSLF